MFDRRSVHSGGSATFRTLEIIFHATVYNLRKGHHNAFIALLLNMLQAIMFVAAFYLMFLILGLRSIAIRGDFLLYIMSGIFMFMAHIKTVRAIANSEGPLSPMMQHAPMNTLIAMCGAALSQLYLQFLTVVLALSIYYCIGNHFEIYDAIGALGCLLVAWFTGVGIGTLFLAINPWAPRLVTMITMVYMRANMIASGKMFVANQLPAAMVAMFDWNPLFHIIDQARGYIFINYIPRNSNIEYPIYIGLAFLLLGFLLEFLGRKNLSISYNAKS